MSAPKFTPGPWRAYQANATSVGDAVWHNGGRWAVSTVHIPNFEQEEANARLIAAAPDMYEELEALESARGIVGLEECVALARVALTKARGEV